MPLRIKFDLRKLFSAVGVSQTNIKKCPFFSFKGECKMFPHTSTFDVDIIVKVQNALYLLFKNVGKEAL